MSSFLRESTVRRNDGRPKRTSRRVPRGSTFLGAWRTLPACVTYVLVACSSGTAGSDCDSLFRPTAPLNIATWWKTPALEASGATMSPASQPPVSRPAEPSAGEVAAGLSLEEGYWMCSAGGEAVLTTVPDLVVPSPDGNSDTVKDKEATLTALEQQASSITGQTSTSADYQGAIVNGGADILRLACRDGSERALEPLGTPDSPFVPFLARRTPQALTSLVSCSGNELYGVILGLHRLNQLFYNERTLSKLGLAGENGLSEKWSDDPGVGKLFDLLESLAERGIPRPLVVDGNNWTWSLLAIENLMVATTGKEVYEEFWSRLSPARTGHQDPDENRHNALTDPVNLVPFNKVLEQAIRLAPYIQVVQGEDQLRDRIACDGLAQDQCGALFVMGDWASPSQPAHVESVPFPGTEKLYVYTADVAVVTRRAEPLQRTDPIVGWLKAVSSAAVQTEYCAKKNCLSVLTAEDGVTRAKTSAELFKFGGETLQGVGGLPTYVPPESFDELGTRVRQFMEAAVDASYEPSDVRAEALAEQRQALTDYVHDEYCSVLKQSGADPDNCLAQQQPAAPIK